MPIFKGTQSWLQEIDKIFQVMAWTNAQKVMFRTHKLSEEVEYWWDNREDLLGYGLHRCSKGYVWDTYIVRRG